MKFVQLIEFKTGDIDAFNRTLDEWLAKTSGVRTPTSGHPRPRPGQRTNLHSHRRVPVLRGGDGELESARDGRVRRSVGQAL